MKTTMYKVLPFETQQGRVEGHEIARHQPPWMAAPISRVVFKDWDDTAKVLIEVSVLYQHFTEYIKRKWPAGGSPVAVITADGTRIGAEGRYVHHENDESYLGAPILCRDLFKLVSGSQTLLEVNGVSEWLLSSRDEVATEQCLACPWQRDNKMAATTKEK